MTNPIVTEAVASALEQEAQCMMNEGIEPTMTWQSERFANAAILAMSEAAGPRVGEVREAFAPFLQHYQPWMDEWPDDADTSSFSRVTFGQLRRAKALLDSLGDVKG